MSVCDGLPTLQKGDAMTTTKIMWPIGMSHNKFTNLGSKYQSRGIAIHCLYLTICGLKTKDNWASFYVTPGTFAL